MTRTERLTEEMTRGGTADRMTELLLEIEQQKKLSEKVQYRFDLMLKASAKYEELKGKDITMVREHHTGLLRALPAAPVRAMRKQYYDKARQNWRTAVEALTFWENN